MGQCINVSSEVQSRPIEVTGNDDGPGIIVFNNTFGEKSPPVKSKQGEILHRPPIEATGNDDGLVITVFNSTVGEMSSPVKSKHGEFFAPPVEVTGNDDALVAVINTFSKVLSEKILYGEWHTLRESNPPNWPNEQESTFVINGNTYVVTILIA